MSVTRISIAFLILFSLHEFCNAKCSLSIGLGAAMCDNVSSLSEIIPEIQPLWNKLRILGRYGSTFSINENQFHDALYYIEELDLSAIGHILISNLGFRPFHQLKYLNLSDASLQSMNSNWFDGNNSLVLLDLRRNQLTSVERSHFQYLNKLIDLDLSDNSIKNIEYFALAEATYLQRVSFRYNRLRNITNIGPLLSLESLDFSSNSISSIHDFSFAGMRNLVNLTLSDNSIRTIEDQGFSGLDHLDILNMSGNSLRLLQSDVFRMPSLRILDISRNDVSVIRANTFAHLRNLKQLILTRNALERLSPNMFNSLTRLEILTLNENVVSYIEDNTFADLRSLKFLDLSENSLRTVSGAIFGSNRLPLRKLFLKSNRLETIQEDFFDSVPDVEYISFANNRISNLPDRVFSPLKNIKKLHIQDNVLTDITTPVVEDLHKVTELLFQNNRLTFLPLATTSFTNLQKISIEGNPWQCPCLHAIFDYLTKHRIKYGHEDNPFFRGEKPICYSVPQCIRDIEVVRNTGIVNKYENALGNFD